MKKILLILILCCFQLGAAGTFDELKTIPIDSANAQDMKIWFPVRADKCKVKLSILDTNNKLVRLLLLQEISNGYYNVFWDKKDDSGKFVSEGDYKVATISCDYKRLEPIQVRYTDGENKAILEAGDDYNQPQLVLKLLDQSLIVTVQILNRVKTEYRSICTDSVMTAGEHIVPWNPDDSTPSGNYFFKVTVNKFSQVIPFQYKRSTK